MKASTASVVSSLLLISPRVNEIQAHKYEKRLQVNRTANTRNTRIKNARAYSFYYCIMQHDHVSVLSFSHVYFVIGYFLRLSYRACLGDIISHISLSCVSCIIFLYFIVSVYRVRAPAHVVFSGSVLKSVGLQCAGEMREKRARAERYS